MCKTVGFLKIKKHISEKTIKEISCFKAFIVKDKYLHINQSLMSLAQETCKSH